MGFQFLAAGAPDFCYDWGTIEWLIFVASGEKCSPKGDSSDVLSAPPYPAYPQEYTCAKTRFNCDPESCYRASAFSVRDRLIETLNDTNAYFHETDCKRAYYLSLEFLLGRGELRIFPEERRTCGCPCGARADLKAIDRTAQRVNWLILPREHSGIGQLGSCGSAVVSAST